MTEIYTKTLKRDFFLICAQCEETFYPTAFYAQGKMAIFHQL